MIDNFENYVNSFPSWYRSMTVFVGLACGITFFQALADGGRFDSGYFRRKAIKAFIGLLFCLGMLWSIPLIIFGLRLIFRWNKSEIDEMLDYKRKQYKKRGLDYDTEMRKQEYEQQENRWREEDERWRKQRALDRERWEREQEDVELGERYFGGM